MRRMIIFLLQKFNQVKKNKLTIQIFTLLDYNLIIYKVKLKKKIKNLLYFLA